MATPKDFYLVKYSVMATHSPMANHLATYLATHSPMVKYSPMVICWATHSPMEKSKEKSTAKHSAICSPRDYKKQTDLEMATCWAISKLMVTPIILLLTYWYFQVKIVYLMSLPCRQ